MNETTATWDDIRPITDPDEHRRTHYVGEGYTGYAPAEGAYVHIHEARDYVQRGVLMATNGQAPALYQVVEIKPAFDFETVGGIAHCGPRYVCLDLWFGWTVEMPAIRLVPADPPDNVLAARLAAQRAN